MPDKEFVLRSCPFCGDNEAPLVVVRRGKDGWRDRFLVLCDYEHGGCGGSSGWYHYESEAVGAWNRRVAADVEPKRRWIPVTERLPENSKSVIIAHQNGVSTGWHNGRYWERGAATGHSKIKTVTHWMPLPEPPKGEDHEIL